ncbi:60Kd inner membrane protein-domain-containing protein [Tuber brumale]|nr:60Kd inner membrane protein-domain-containing protein [Tuber brumale]
MLASKLILRSSSSSTASIALRRIPQPASSRKISSFVFSRASRLPQPLPPKTFPKRAPLTALRFNSTSSTTPPLPEPTFLPDYIPTTQSVSAPLPTSEHIGFLKEFGLDYGYGFTTLVQSLIEHVHVYAGTPWFATIILSVGVLRLLQFPFYLKMSDTAAKMKELNPFAVPLTKKMHDAQTAGNTLGMVAARTELGQLYSRSGVKRRWLFFPISQVPVFYGFYKNLRGMSDIPIPELTEGGLSWFTDLSVADPFYLLPMATSASLFAQLSLGGEAGTNLQSEQMKKILLIFLPLVTFAFTSQWPAVLTFYFLCNSLFSLVQTIALKNAWVRAKFGLYPMPNQAVPNPLETLPFKTMPTPTSASSEEVRQIGGKGSWMDRITGGSGSSNTDATKSDKTEDGGFLGGMFSGGGEKAAHKAYEAKRQERIAKARDAKRELRLRRKRMQHEQNQD